jgi:ferritin-like metal-binding protein YciE
MTSLDSLEALLQDELKDIYDAEKQLTRVLPKLAKKATSTELKKAFEEHLRQTEGHIERIEEVFEQLGMPARGKKCEGMQHLIAEGEDMIGKTEDNATRDAVMIASARKVEHYEIASYGTLRTWADQLEKPGVAARRNARRRKRRRSEVDGHRGKFRQRSRYWSVVVGRWSSVVGPVTNGRRPMTTFYYPIAVASHP